MSLLRSSALPLATLLIAACTTTDPYTGEQRVDETATAGAVAGLAILGAAAYAASHDDDDDDDHRHRHHRHHRDYDGNRHASRVAVYNPRRNITCYTYRRACYDRRGHYSSKWTRREFR